GRPFGTNKREYLARYQHDWAAWLDAERASWARPGHHLVKEVAAWFEPLLERAPITSAGIAGNVVIDVDDDDANLCIDFVESQVRVWRGEPCVYKIDVDRALIEALVQDPLAARVN